MSDKKEQKTFDRRSFVKKAGGWSAFIAATFIGGTATIASSGCEYSDGGGYTDGGYVDGGYVDGSYSCYSCTYSCTYSCYSCTYSYSNYSYSAYSNYSNY